jgi:hypothetical protein
VAKFEAGNKPTGPPGRIGEDQGKKAGENFVRETMQIIHWKWIPTWPARE